MAFPWLRARRVGKENKLDALHPAELGSSAKGHSGRAHEPGNEWQGSGISCSTGSPARNQS